MGEQPIFSTQAHVFHIDPNTKKNWIPASNQAVPVSFFFDTTRSSYRIISVDANKAVINSTITPNMVFTKTSQKFGQWADPRANTIYGLGFATENDLGKFHEKFKEVKEATRIASQKQNGTLQSQLREDGSGNQSPKLRLHNSPGLIQTATPDSPKSPSTFPTTEAQLKYENEKLKIALAQSSTNAKKWEQELETLNNNNKRLTTALQESTANVEEWKKQLMSFKEENALLKEKLKTSDLNDSNSSLTDDKEQELNSKIRRLENENEVKEKEINMLKEQLDELKAETVTRETLEKKIQDLEVDKQTVQRDMEKMDAELSDCRKAMKAAAALQETLTSKMRETLELQKEIESTLKIS